MKLHKDGNLLIFRYPGNFTLASALLLLVPLAVGLYGFWGIATANSEWDSVLLIPLGICSVLILVSVFAAHRLIRQQRGPQPTQALIFDNAAGRVSLTTSAWNRQASVNLDALPGYSYDQFTGWQIRSYTVSGGGNDRMNRSTSYAVSLRKTDGGYFDVFETGWEPVAESVLRELSSEIPLEGPKLPRTPRPSLALPASIEREQSLRETVYRWNPAFSWGGYLRGIGFVTLVGSAFLLVLSDATGDEANLMRLGFASVAITIVLVVLAVAVAKSFAALRTAEYLAVRSGVLEHGTVPRDRARADQRRVRQTLNMGSILRVRYDRSANTRSSPALWFPQADGQTLFLELKGLSEGEVVILEQSLELDIRQHGGKSE